VELFKKYYFYFFISFIFSLDNELNNIVNFSSTDFSIINNSEFQFNFGVQSNDLVEKFYYISIDKLISNNLFFSTKISRYQDENSEIYNQNSLSYFSKDNPFNCSFSFNYLTDNNEINRWTSFGLFFDYKIKSKIILYPGVYFDFTNFNNEPWKTTNYYLSSKLQLSNNINSLISLTYNPDYSIINQSIEFSISL